MRKGLLHIGAAALLFIMIVKTASLPIVCIDFAINQDYIARTLCENKAKPAMHCNGKCYMKKKLAQTTGSENAADERGNIRVTLIDFTESAADHCFFQPFTGLTPARILFPSSLHAGIRSALLRPPIA